MAHNLREGLGPHQSTTGQLADDVAQLRKIVEVLDGRIAALELRRPVHHEEITAAVDDVFLSEEVVAAPGRGVLLPRVAAVCFLLVFALILRTLTDNGVLNVRLGTLIGLGYGLALTLCGWWLFVKKSRVAPVFPVCGILLLFAVVFEVHSRFDMLPSLPAHVLLFLALLTVAVIGLRFRAPLLLSIGTLGTGLVGLSLDFPTPMFPATAVLLFTGIWVGYLAAEKGISRSLRWTQLLLVVVFWLAWALKLKNLLSHGGEQATLLYMGWFFPMLFLFFALYLFLAVRYARRSEGGLGLFEFILPSVNAFLAYAVGMGVAVPWLWPANRAGFLAVAAGFVHLGFASFLARGRTDGAPGISAFAVAGIILLVLGVPFATGGLVWAFPFWSVAAFFLVLFSRRWNSGGVRIISYLLQVFACGMAIFAGAFVLDGLPLAVNFAFAVLLSVMALLQYRWCRANRPSSQGAPRFPSFDSGDVSAVVLLVVCLVGVFAALRLVLHEGLIQIMADSVNSFQCGQTVLINTGAVMLLCLALRHGNIEIMSVGIGVGAVGALKVIAYDMFTAQGVPLVWSVFSFGIVATVGSMVSSRWQQSRKTAAEAVQDGEELRSGEDNDSSLTVPG